MVSIKHQSAFSWQFLIYSGSSEHSYFHAGLCHDAATWLQISFIEIPVP